jgi:exodeoxyribonuclease V gamma subunit
MFVHRSNRMETLVDALAEVVRQPLADPFAADCIIVQGQGMERWLSMELARRFGVWANPDFPFPRRFIERTFKAVLDPPGERRDPYQPEVLVWTIADLLPGLLDRRELDEVRAYLARTADHSPTRPAADADFHLIALAGRIATVFDQYALFRPQWTAEWENGGDGDWQAILWRKIVQRHGPHHVAARARRWLRALQTGPAAIGLLPQRLCVFGLSTLPPLYLELLAALAVHAQVHLFLLSPSREYWAWIRSQREVWRRRSRQAHGSGTDLEADAREAQGNPLLASLGRLGRDFQEVLEGSVDYLDDDLYVDPGLGSLLTTLQSDILHLRHRRANSSDAAPLFFDAGDESIRIHACHSPMREVEVLHDQLLDLFEHDRSLEPRDVIVLSPDIDAYAPFVDAVFGSNADRDPRIPYRIADRKLRATDDIIDTFLVVLATLRGRFTGPEIMDLLSRQPVHAQFGIVAEELDRLREWIRAAGIRWGVDAEHRRSVDQPQLDEHTWRFGLDRLLLGYAMQGGERRLFHGVLPYDDMEGTVTELLGRVSECLERLFAFRRRLQAPRSLPQWRDDLTALLGAMLVNTDDTAHQHRQIRLTLTELAAQAQDAGFSGSVDLDSVRARLEAALERHAPGRAFLTGGVTFCALVPMRSIPFRIVCLLGMNDSAFPRAQRPLGFDLMAQRPVPGDRTVRDDDRYLFLEALLAARQRLLITYIGQSVRDNAEIPPAVVISELLDVIEESFQGPTQEGTVGVASPQGGFSTIRDHLIIRHPLQPFSQRYFNSESNLFSYARQHFEGAERLTQSRVTARPFVTQPLPDIGERTVTIADLVSFFERPARAFAQRRLALSLGSDLEPLDDREPLVLDTLAGWKVGTSLVKQALEGDDLEQALARVRASGVLPPGELGSSELEDIRATARELASATAKYTTESELAALQIDHCLDDSRVAGVLSHLWPSGQIQQQFSKVGSRREIGLWVRHLLLNWAGRADTPRQTVLIGRGPKQSIAIVRFKPVQHAETILRQLLQLYWMGQRVPLPLFANTSRVFVEKLRKTGKESDALKAAEDSLWNDRGFSDSSDPYFQQIYGSADPLVTPIGSYSEAAPPSFVEVAQQVFGPLLDHREEIE